jgi:hypothetical protein
MGFHAQVQGFYTAQHQEAIHRAGRSAAGIVDEPKLFISSSSFSIKAPITTSLWPPMYLVTECITISAPRSIGFCRYGEAKSIINCQFQVFFFADLRLCFNIHNLHRWIGRRFYPDQFGIFIYIY